MDFRDMFNALMDYLKSCVGDKIAEGFDNVCAKLQAILDVLLGLNPNDFELKTIPSGDFCCPDGKKYCSIICQKFKNGDKYGEEIIYVDKQTGQIVESLPDCAEPCGEVDAECSPKMVDFLGDSAPKNCEFNSFSLEIPSCCGVKITTSAGSYTFDPKNYTRILCEDFDCLLTDYKIEGLNNSDKECVDSIRTYLKKSK